MNHQYVNQVAPHHPVLSLVAHKDSLHANERLCEYASSILNGDAPMPTLTQFCEGYVEEYFREISLTKRIELVAFGMFDILDKLGKLAFNEMVKGKKITKENLQAAFQTQKNDRLMYLTFDFLEESSNKGVYVFRERIVYEYLIALYQYNRILELVRDKKCLGLSTAMVESVRMLHKTADIWGMTFALMSEDGAARNAQEVLLREVIRQGLKVMMPSQVTLFCLQAIYESQNKGRLSDLLNDFTYNDTINLSQARIHVPVYRMPYTLYTVGYLVRNSSELYGINLSGLDLGEQGIRLLSDPTYQVSDNRLQMLNLSHNPLGVTGVQALMRFMVKANWLTWLDVSHCELGNEGVQLVAHLLECHSLSSLNLSHNMISEQGILYLVKNFKFCYAMEYLDLSNNKLSNQSATLLASAIGFLPRLQRLELVNNPGISLRTRLAFNSVTRDLTQQRLAGKNIVDHWHKDRTKVTFGDVGDFVIVHKKPLDAAVPGGINYIAEEEDGTLERASTLKECDMESQNSGMYTPMESQHDSGSCDRMESEMWHLYRARLQPVFADSLESNSVSLSTHNSESSQGQSYTLDTGAFSPAAAPGTRSSMQPKPQCRSHKNGKRSRQTKVSDQHQTSTRWQHYFPSSPESSPKVICGGREARMKRIHESLSKISPVRKHRSDPERSIDDGPLPILLI